MNVTSMACITPNDPRFKELLAKVRNPLLAELEHDKEMSLGTSDVAQVKKNIADNLPSAVANVVNVVEYVPLDIRGNTDIQMSMQSLLEDTDIKDPLLINWLGINQSTVNAKTVESTNQLESIIKNSYNNKIKQSKPFLKNEAKVQFEKWEKGLEKYPLPFKDAILKYAIKNLINPKRTNKFVISFSEIALNNVYRDVINQPHKLNQAGSIYNSELIRLTSDATEHEPSASGKGYWVHVPRTESKATKFNNYYVTQYNNGYEITNGFNQYDYYKSKQEAETKLKELQKYESSAQFKANVELLRKLSPQSWCTASSMAEYYVENFDNYILIVDGKTVAGIEAKSEIKSQSTIDNLNKSIQLANGNREKLIVERNNKFYIHTPPPNIGSSFSSEGRSVYAVRDSKEEAIALFNKQFGEQFNSYIVSKEEEIRKLSSNKRQVKEVTSIVNKGVAPIDHIDDIVAFFEKHNLDLDNQSVKNALRAKKQGKTDKDLMEIATEPEGPYNPYGEGYDMDGYPEEPDWEAEEAYWREQQAYQMEMMEAEAEEIDRLTNLQEPEEAIEFLRNARFNLFNRMYVELRSDERVAEVAIEKDSHNITFVPQDLPFYKELAHKAVIANPAVFNYISDEAKAEQRNIDLHERHLEEVRNIAALADDLPFSQTKDSRIQGYYDPKTDKVVVVASNTPVKEGAQVAIHEVAHRGMVRMAKELGGTKELYEALSAAKTQLMKKLPELLKRTGHKNLEDLMLDYGFDPSSKDGELKLLSELAARWAETLVGKPKPSWWKRFLQSIKNWIKQFTGKILSENQVDELVGGFVKYGTAKDKKLSDKEIEFSKKEKPTQEVKPEVKELFDSNPELANKVYEALGFYEPPITSKDKIIFGHPTIGKTFLKEQGRTDFISFDDDFADEINNFVNEHKGNLDKYQYKQNKPKEYIEFSLNLYDKAKAKAKKEGKILLTSSNIIFENRIQDFDKVINLDKNEFFNRIGKRNTTYDIKAWKNQIDNLISKVNPNKVINTKLYLSDLLKNTTIKPTDKIIWGHPAIGKSYAAKKVKMIDFDSYKLGINRKYNLYIAPGLSDTELRTDDKTREARENWRYEKPENAELWNQFIRDAWQQAKKDAKEQGAILFASDLLVLREFGNEVDKALTMSDELFFERSKQRNNFIEGELGTKVWKGNLNKAVNNFKEKFGEDKVINTEKYLSDLFITPEQKQQALQLYSQYLDTGKQDIEGFKEFVETRPAVIPKSEYSYLLDEPSTPNSSVSNKIDMSKDYQNLEKMYKSLTFEERIKLGSLEDIIAARSNWPEEFIIDWINCNK